MKTPASKKYKQPVHNKDCELGQNCKECPACIEQVNQDNPKVKFTDLFEASVYVSIKNGVRVVKRKFKTKFTGKNYIPVMLEEADEKNGYIYNLYSRVQPEEILEIRDSHADSNFDSMNRHIYYLDGQEDKAVKLLRDEMETRLQLIASNSATMLQLWKNRK
jgi:hypothetical protein